MSYQIASQASEFGWLAPKTNHSIVQAATLIGCSEAETKRQIYTNAREAVRAAIEYGAEQAAQRIPLPPLSTDGASALETVAEHPGNPDFQLRILRELSAMLSERVDINALLSMVLEGIFRGVAVDRAVLALVSADGTRIAAKFVLGGGDPLTRQFNYSLSDRDNLIVQLLFSREPVWVNCSSPRWRQHLTPELLKVVSETEFFAFPLSFAGKARGLFYADRKISRHPLDERSYDAFRHFCEQALIGLSIMGMRNS